MFALFALWSGCSGCAGFALWSGCSGGSGGSGFALWSGCSGGSGFALWSGGSGCSGGSGGSGGPGFALWSGGSGCSGGSGGPGFALCPGCARCADPARRTAERFDECAFGADVPELEPDVVRTLSAHSGRDRWLRLADDRGVVAAAGEEQSDDRDHECDTGQTEQFAPPTPKSSLELCFLVVDGVEDRLTLFTQVFVPATDRHPCYLRSALKTPLRIAVTGCPSSVSTRGNARRLRRCHIE